MNSMRPRSFISLLASILFGIFTIEGTTSQADEQQLKSRDIVDVQAQTDFNLYCADCHGQNGRGQGPKTFGLSKLPPDLTTLTKRNNGVYPKDRLVRIIDGREEVKEHGSREMPAWGGWFKIETEEGLGGVDGDEVIVQRRIDSLVKYLETMQR
jgi:Cytochrome C oxidase, cbb3-type, subunit III